MNRRTPGAFDMAGSIRPLANPRKTPYLRPPEDSPMMVSCPGCNTSYSLDERRIPAGGGHLTCRECGNKWKVGGPSRVSLTPAPPVIASKPDASPERAEATPSTAPASHTQVHLPGNDSSATLSRPVNCPKCGHFFVPASTQPAEAAALITGSHHPKARILVVEDQNYFAELTREALGDSYETTVASNLAAAR